jgi:Fis family transcriptional regulator
METVNLQEGVVRGADNHLHASIKQSVERYFNDLNGEPVGNLYDLVLAEIEKPLFEAVLKQTKGNQSKAAIILGLSRGTLRKKLKSHGFLG